jgi:hypothetical protein
MNNHLKEVRDHELEQRRRSTTYFLIFTVAALVVILGVLLAMHFSSGAQ